MKKVLSLMAVLVLSAALLTGCGGTASAAAQRVEEPVQTTNEVAETLTGGVLCLKVNPEIALYYDGEGKVLKLEGRNAEGTQILENFADCTGKDMAQALEELVIAIGKAGYFVEEVEGTAQQIVLELDPGSSVPNEQFLHNMAAHVKTCVERRCWVSGEESAAEAVPAATQTVAENVCPVCYDDDCDDGEYCDDYDDRGENVRERERRQDAAACTVCGEYDCDNGVWCDNWDERHENGHHGKDHD